MGKRSDFRRRKNDAYDTPIEPVLPLFPHLPERFTFDEPCAGSGQLADVLENFGGVPRRLFDIEPRRADVQKRDVFAVMQTDAQWFITNPPWTRAILHPLILHLSLIAPTWLLFDADWAFTKQAQPYMRRCRKVVAVGRVKWIPGSPHTGKDNCAWYLFTHRENEPTLFFEREDD